MLVQSIMIEMQFVEWRYYVCSKTKTNVNFYLHWFDK